MGKALKLHGIPRSKVVIMTKCFRPVTDPAVDPDIGVCTAFDLDLARKSKDYVNHFGKPTYIPIVSPRNFVPTLLPAIFTVMKLTSPRV